MGKEKLEKQVHQVQVKTIGFDIEKISDLLLAKIEELHPENSGVVLTKYHEISEQFELVKYLKKKNQVQTLDLVLVYENSTDKIDPRKDEGYLGYKKEIAEVYRRLDYKLGRSQKVTLYTRGGAEGIPSFHFPAGLNFWVLSNNNFLRSRIQPWMLVNLGIDGRFDQYRTKCLDQSEIWYIEKNPWFDYAKHVQEAWKPDPRMTVSELAERYNQDQSQVDEHGVRRKNIF